MTRQIIGCALATSLATLAACSDSTGIAGKVNCSSPQAASLSPGQFVLHDPSTTPCTAVPAAGTSGAEYLYVAAATAGQETQNGLSAPYLITGTGAAATANVGAMPAPLLHAFQPPSSAARFHQMLRAREQAEAASGAVQVSAALARLPLLAVTKPTLGSKKNFNVCATTDCATFVPVTATAMNVSGKVAIFQEDSLPSGVGFTQSEIDNVATLFDNYLYPIDTTNFGRETDIDNNGVVQVLLTGKINELSKSFCSQGSVILGYFLSTDLKVSDPNSNKGEVFYSIVPDTANKLLPPNCSAISRRFAESNLAPTFIHEFQHMISYGQHVLIAQGTQAELTWLNEGLSHYAEELGGRLIPDANNPTLPPCTLPPCPNTYSQFAVSDFQNAYDYLTLPEQTFLIEPGSSTGELAERGANWLFVRWLAEEFGAATPNPGAPNFIVKATDFTRKLDQTNETGVTNVEHRSGRTFGDLVTLWQLANYLDNLPGFAPADSLLQYENLNLRDIYAQLHAGDPSIFSQPYPLVPDTTSGNYRQSGTLKQGSARHVRIQQAANGAAVQLLLSSPDTTVISATIAPRIGLVRIK